jgi:ferredoxin--NADP+ reductase
MRKEIDPDRWSRGKVYALHRWTDALYSVQVEADVQPFLAGQFTKLGMEIDDEFVERPYSYVNAPHEKPLEFYFVTVLEGPLSQRMTTLERGDTLWVMRKPAGFLTLNEVPDAPHLWMLSTGTAIGPFLSILKTEQPWERFERVVLVHAVRKAEELSYGDSMRRLRDTHADRFQFVPFVSREHTSFALPGRIPAALESALLERHVGMTIAAGQSQVMICGNPQMVKDTSAILQQRGLQRNRRRTPGHITVENYW